jgi:hypothetical protein
MRTYGLKFSQVFREKRVSGKASLRRTQWKLAQKSTPMAIWLGKQYLGQRDVPDTRNDEIPDDGFTEAIKGTAADDWSGDV